MLDRFHTVFLAASLTACAADVTQPAGDDDGTPTEISVSGSITESATWTGTVSVTGAAVIEAGVAITIEPGTTVKLAPMAGITVAGTLDAAGTKASPITISPDTAGGAHRGFVIPTGGELRLSYVTQYGGGINTTGGTAIIVDSEMSRQRAGDFLVMDGGAIDVTHSRFGLDAGAVESDTTHCDIHLNRASSVRISNSIVTTAPYGLMFFGGSDADLTNNNWLGNGQDITMLPGVSGDVTGSWFQDGAPSTMPGTSLAGLEALSANPVADAGPR